MIPRHTLPFGVSRIITALGGAAVSIPDLEKAYAQALGVPEAVVLPSVRAGIAMAIQAVNTPGMTVIGPAYTCHSVHEAMALGGAPTRLIDAASGGFLMAPDGVGAMGSDCVLVLSEVYGIPYHRDMLDSMCRKGCRLRIRDLAMEVPCRERLQQLEIADVALFSFGWGKPMYAGWGGIACLQDPELAGKIREIRARFVTTKSHGLAFRNGYLAFFQGMLNQSCLYGVLHEQHFYRWCKKISSLADKRRIAVVAEGEEGHFPPVWSANVRAPQWTRPMAAMNCRLALDNLSDVVRHADLRRRQAELYFRQLVEPGVVRGPGIDSLPQSHFPILVAAQFRDELCDYLRGRGVDTSTLFPLCSGLSRNCYPHAALASDQVITLPLGPVISLEEVKDISIKVAEGLRELTESIRRR